ncbi:MAG: hypothetical protein ACSHWU_08130 [Marinicella sp.]
MSLIKNKRMLQLIVCLCLLIFTVSNAQEINWYSTDQGGGISTHADTVVTGVIGQVDTLRMEGGSLTISGGYLPLPADLIFENQFD